MVKIYSAGNISEAHIVKGMLEAQGISAYVGGHYLQGGIGELAALDFAAVYVEDEDQQDAQAIITEYENSGNSPVTDNAIEDSSIDLGFPLFLIVVCIVLLVLILSLT